MKLCIKTASIFLIISFLFYEGVWAQPNLYYCLRPQPVEERSNISASRETTNIFDATRQQIVAALSTVKLDQKARKRKEILADRIHDAIKKDKSGKRRFSSHEGFVEFLVNEVLSDRVLAQQVADNFMFGVRANDDEARTAVKGPPSKEPSFTDQQERRRYYEKRREKVNEEIARAFIKKYPRQRNFVKMLNETGLVNLSDFIGTLLMGAINENMRLSYETIKGELENLITKATMKKLMKTRSLQPSLPPQESFNEMDALIRLLQDAPAVADFIRTILPIVQATGDKEDGMITDMLLYYQAIERALELWQVEAASAKRGFPPNKLPFAQLPSCAAANKPFLDLASGTNFEFMLLGTMVNKNRPFVIVDKSDKVQKYWKYLAAIMGLNNISGVCDDIKNLDRHYQKESVGTIRMCNIAAWVPDLSDEWFDMLFDFIAPGGQIVLPLSISLEKNNIPRTVTFDEMLKRFNLGFKVNETFMSKVLCAYEKRKATWELVYGHIDQNGGWADHQTGFMNPSGYSAESLIVFQRVAAKLQFAPLPKEALVAI